MDFIMREKLKKIKDPFLARKFFQYWSRVYQKVHNSNIFGGMFPKKSWFCQYFYQIIMILVSEIIMELHYNLKNLKSGLSHKNIDKIYFFLGNIPPKILLICIFWYTLDQYWYIFLAKIGISNLSVFPPL